MPQNKRTNCDCISLNRPEDYQKAPSRKMKMLCGILTNGERKYKEVCVDECIADDIKKLWDNNVFTLGSCCGHGETDKSVVISSDSDYERAQKLLPDFQICYWKLIQQNKQTNEEIDKSLREEIENLKCVNGAMYFGAVDRPCSGRDTGECCHNEQTFEEAVTELETFIVTKIATLQAKDEQIKATHKQTNENKEYRECEKMLNELKNKRVNFTDFIDWHTSRIKAAYQRGVEDMVGHECCDGECNHDDCCGKVEENCPLTTEEKAKRDELLGNDK